MSINKARAFMYKLAKFLGDVQAVKRGNVSRRVGRRAYGKVSGKLARKLFR